MKKKATTWFEEQAVGLIVTLIGVVIVGGFIWLILSNVLSNNDEIKLAQKSADYIQANIESLNDGKKVSLDLQGVGERWFLTAWGLNNPDRPDACFFESCICICQGQCETKPICRNIKEKIVYIQSYNLVSETTSELVNDIIISRPTGKYHVSSSRLIPLPDNIPLLDAEISKGTEPSGEKFISITHYTPFYNANY